MDFTNERHAIGHNSVCIHFRLKRREHAYRADTVYKHQHGHVEIQCAPSLMNLWTS